MLPSRSELQLGTNYTFIASVSFFMLTHACSHFNAHWSFVLSETALKITALMSLIMCFLIRHKQLPGR